MAILLLAEVTFCLSSGCSSSWSWIDDGGIVGGEIILLLVDVDVDVESKFSSDGDDDEKCKMKINVVKARKPRMNCVVEIILLLLHMYTNCATWLILYF